MFKELEEIEEKEKSLQKNVKVETPSKPVPKEPSKKVIE